MAQVILDKIDKIEPHLISLKRTCGSMDDLAYPELVKKKYIDKNYDSFPRTKKEAEELDQKHYNDIALSMVHYNIYSDASEKILEPTFAETRYFYGQALRDLVNEGKYSYNQLKEMTPRIAHCALVVPLKVGNEYFLLSQVRGKARGRGQIISTAVSGFIGKKSIEMYKKDRTKNLLINALESESIKELGIDLSFFNFSPAFMMDEPEVGPCNFTYITRDANLGDILSIYEKDATERISKGEELEVAGLSLLPIKPDFPLDKIICYIPNKKGELDKMNFDEYIEKYIENKEEIRKSPFRPYTEAVIEYVADQENVKFLLEKAGF